MKDAGNWIKKTADQVVAVFKPKAQVAAREYVSKLAQLSGVNDLPSFSLAELESFGFNKNAFAQMDV